MDNRQTFLKNVLHSNRTSSWGVDHNVIGWEKKEKQIRLPPETIRIGAYRGLLKHIQACEILWQKRNLKLEHCAERRNWKFSETGFNIFICPSSEIYCITDACTQLFSANNVLHKGQW